MQRTYGQFFDISRPGFLSGIGEPRVRAYKNSADNLADYYTFAIPASPTVSTLYSITDALGNTASYTTPATSPTQADLGAGLLSAIRRSILFSVASVSLAANVLTVTSRNLAAPLILTSVGLTGTAFNIGLAPSGIPFGVFVARRSTDLADEARLPTATTDKLLGIAMSTYAIEKDAKGTSAKVVYQPLEMMDILDRCNDLDGIYVSCVEADLNLTDTLYVVASGSNAGYLTRSSSGTIALTQVGLVRGTVVNSDGTRMALLSINFS